MLELLLHCYVMQWSFLIIIIIFFLDFVDVLVWLFCRYIFNKNLLLVQQK